MTTQYKIMQAWASGDFVNDLGNASPVEESLPDALDRMALEACVGAALYPGVEVNGYVMNFPERFIEGEPFRISHEKVVPGEVTQYNAVPWQADFLLCSWQETMGVLPIRLGWWPAQRPDDVFTAVGATKMLPWARGIGTDFQDMIDKWDRLGVVVDRGAAWRAILRRDRARHNRTRAVNLPTTSNSQPTMPLDAMILGGGPAGTATARALSQAGRSVTVMERSCYESPRIGEALPPEVSAPVDRAGRVG